MVLIITVLKSHSGFEKKMCMFKFLVLYFITTAFGERKDPWVGEFELTLEREIQFEG